MAITNASRVADFGSGIGTEGAIIQVDNTNARLGIGTANPQAMLQVGTGVTVYGNSGIVSATSFYGDGANLTGDIQVGGTQTGTINLGTHGAGQEGIITFNSTGNEYFDIKVKGSTSSYGNIRFFTGNVPTERVRVTSAGLVGIGTESPGSYETDRNDLVIGNATGNRGITISSADDGFGNIAFADTNSGAGRYVGNISYDHENDRMDLQAGGLMRMRIDSSGDVTIGDGDLVIGTAGHGIDFSAQTASSATGATTGSEVLDHYEEGTFTPTLYGSTGSAGSAADTNAVGKYTKIGRLVQASISIVKTNLGSWTGDLRVGGLPFTAGSDTAGSLALYPSANVDAAMRGIRLLGGTTYCVIQSGSKLDGLAPYSEIVTGYYLTATIVYHV